MGIFDAGASKYFAGPSLQPEAALLRCEVGLVGTTVELVLAILYLECAGRGATRAGLCLFFEQARLLLAHALDLAHEALVGWW